MGSAQDNRPSIEPHLKLIRLKCTEAVRRYHHCTTVEDLVQEVALWWYGEARPDQLEELVRDASLMRLRRSVWRVADRAARRAQRWSGPDEAFVAPRYSGREVLELIPVAMERGGLPDGGGVKDGPRAHNNLAEGGDVMAALIDVRRALDALTGEDHGYLAQLRSVRWSYELLAHIEDVEPDSVRRRVARIATRMANWLNNEEDEEAA